MVPARTKAICGRLIALAMTASCLTQGFSVLAVEPQPPQWVLLPPGIEPDSPAQAADFLDMLLATQDGAKAKTSVGASDESEVKTSASESLQPKDIDAAESNASNSNAEGAENSIESRFASFQDTLASLEESIDEVADEAGNTSIVQSGSSKSTMKVVGRVHFDLWGFDTEDAANFNGGDPQNRIGFRRMRFGVRGTVKDNMEYRIEMEFAGGNLSEFRDAWLGWNDLPCLQTVLLGNQKRPYGLDHLNSSRFNVFIERPFVIEGFNQDARRPGLQSYGFSDDLRWNWRYGVFNQQNIQSTGNYLGDNLQLQVAGRLASTVWYDDISGGRGYAHLAVSGTHADSTDGLLNNQARFRTRPEARTLFRFLDTGAIAGADHYELIGLEGVFNVGAVQVVGEYQSLWQDRKGFADTRFGGGYVYLSYFLTGEHMPWNRENGTLARIVPFQNFWLVNRCDGCREAGWGAWQVAVRYSAADFSDKDVLGGEGEAFTFGLNWYWNPNARMQFNYITGDIDNRIDGGIPENGNYNVFGARFMIDF